MANSAKPLAKATSTWKRSKPIVRRQSAGRRDSLKPEPGERKRGEVGQHMAGVGDQRQRAGGDAARHLGEHEGAGQRRGEPHAPLVVGVSRAMAMARVAVALRMRSVHRAHAKVLRGSSASRTASPMKMSRLSMMAMTKKAVSASHGA